MKKQLLTIALLAICSFSFSQNGKALWKNASKKSDAVVFEDKMRVSNPRVLELDVTLLKQKLANAPTRFASQKAGVTVSFPNAEGNQENFTVQEFSNMDPALAARYPEIKSYVGRSVENPSDMVYFSLSPLGLQSMTIRAGRSAEFIEPYTTDLSTYTVYKKSETASNLDHFECSLGNRAVAGDTQEHGGAAARPNADDGKLRNYRLAISVTGEYAAYFGGTKALALAAVNNTITRVNAIFERDFGVHMNLVANTDATLYTAAATDPYSAASVGAISSNVGSLLGWNLQLQNTMTSVIGDGNYDIGHLFGATGGGGNAGCIACVCRTPTAVLPIGKGSGFTSPANGIPKGDTFDIDYVAHEMAHQFGASHTFTYSTEASISQMEPGSGSTIMGYAGITGPNDVQAHSDAYFHAISIQQVTYYVKSTTCQTTVATNNATPTASAGADYTIPKGTPFMLTGTGTDTNNDALTYTWEELDRGNSTSSKPLATALVGPSFRSFAPTTSRTRYFPRLETIKTGATSWTWEALPSVARVMNFRLTVRDNRAGGSANNSDDMVLTINALAGPFSVTSQNSAVTYQSGTTQTVTWNVAGTTANGVNAANVDILLSKDGGNTYPITLASATPNDGSQPIVIPNEPGTQNRIMVKGSGHIFFDISNADFTITSGTVETVAPTSPTNLAASGTTTSATNLTWTAATDNVAVAGYDVYQNGTLKTTVSGTTLAVTGLTAATANNFYVKAKDAVGNVSSPSNTLTVTTLAVALDATAPTAPTALAAGSTTKISTILSWSASTDNVAVTSYYIYKNGVFLTSSTTRAFSVTGLTAATTYSFTVKAIDAAGNLSAASNTVSVTTLANATGDTTIPTTPTNLAASGTTQTATVLTWTASTDNVGVVSYSVFQNGTSIASATATTYTVSGLTASTAYSFTIKAKDAAGNLSIVSNTATITTLAVGVDTTAPTAPTNLAASAITQTSAKLTWTASTDNVGVATYSVYKNGTYVTGVTTPTYTVTGLAAGTTYAFTVKGKDAAQNLSAVSNTVNVTTLAGDTTAPTAPTNLAASAITQTSVKLDWTASTDNVGVATYSVYKNGTYITGVTSPTYTVTGLTAGTTYAFTVKGKDAAQNLSAASNVVNVATPTSAAATAATTPTASAITAAVSSAYCTNQGNSAVAEKIGKVAFATINNASTGSSAYENFSSIAANVTKGTNYTISITPSWTSTKYNEGYAVFIDYNNDGDFIDAGEKVVSKAASQTTPQTVSFTIPSTATNGAKTMRVVMKRDGIPAACETFTYGQVEDYTINIISTSRGIEETAAANETETVAVEKLDFKLYPNPVSGSELNISNVSNASFRIINLLGQEIQKGTVENESIPVSNISEGTYLLEVTSDGQTAVKRFIKR